MFKEWGFPSQKPRHEKNPRKFELLVVLPITEIFMDLDEWSLTRIKSFRQHKHAITYLIDMY